MNADTISVSCTVVIFAAALCGLSFAGSDLGQGPAKGKSPVPFSALVKPAKG